MGCLYRGYNVISWRFIWLKIITKWTPSCHEFDEAQSIPTFFCLTGHLLTHRCIVFSRKLQNRAPNNLKYLPNGNEFGKTNMEELNWIRSEKTHVFVLWDSLSFDQKTHLKLIGQNYVFPLIWCRRSTRARWVVFDQ